MSQLPAFRYNAQSATRGLTLPGSKVALVSDAAPKTGQRRKIWELSTNFHCSIVGTCLTGAELRQFLHRMGETDAKTATDHALHGRGVLSAGRADIAGKQLNKVLDRRHETLIKRFSKMKTADEVRQLWRQCFDEGEIGGAYWAALTHPAADRAVLSEVFGDVHMLSHLVGSASRLDIARLQRLQREAEQSSEKLARQEARLHLAAAEQNHLQQKIASLEDALIHAQAAGHAASEDRSAGLAHSALRNRLEAETARAEALASRLAATEAKLQDAEKHAALLGRQQLALQGEVDALEARLFADDGAAVPAGDQAGPDQASSNPAGAGTASVLYVGGRRNLFDRLRALADDRGIALLIHDGGIEDSNSHLPGLVGQSDLALLPIDCVSHSAALMVKRLCRDTGKRFLPLRSASLTSFLASLDSIQAAVHA